MDLQEARELLSTKISDQYAIQYYFYYARNSSTLGGWYNPIVVLNTPRLFVHESVRCDSFVKIEAGEGTIIEKNIHIASFCHLGIGGGIMILEEGSAYGSGSKIITGSNVPGYNRSCSAIDPTCKIEKSFVWIKRNAVLFCGAIVLPGVTVGENSVIAAGAVVRCDVPDYEIWGGVPAKKIGEIGPNKPNICTICGLHELGYSGGLCYNGKSHDFQPYTWNPDPPGQVVYPPRVGQGDLPTKDYLNSLDDLYGK